MLGYGDEIIGLTDENLNDIIYHYLYPKVLNELKDKLNGKKN